MNLQFNNVKKYYGAFLALNVPDLLVGDGIWWLKGENGSGKTTFLKMIAALHPFDGSIVLNDVSLKKSRQQFLRQVSYAEAEPLYPNFITARDLVTLYCKVRNGNPAEAFTMLEQLHIADAYKKPIGTYSSGMIKKLSLALAFIGDAKLVVLDEPLITIDVNAVDVVCKMIATAYSQGTSFIITSHQSLHQDQLQFSGTLLAANQTVEVVQ